jgi:DNA-binding transcriptional ArsR family regulator
MGSWTFLSNHGRALLCIAHDPDVRLRDIAAELGITERRAYALVSDLADGGYVVKERDGRRNRYSIEEHLPVPELIDRDLAIGEVLGVLRDR